MTNVRPDFSLNPMAALVVAYNTVAEHLPETKPVSKFTDKATAVARLNKILDVAHDAGLKIDYLPNGAINAIVDMTDETSGFVPPTEDPTLKVISTDGATTVAEPVVTASTKQTPKRQSALMGKTITLVVEQNPKRKDSRTRVRYDLYKTGLTTDEYLATSLAQGLGTVREVLSDLHYDSTMGFIKLS